MAPNAVAPVAPPGIPSLRVPSARPRGGPRLTHGGEGRYRSPRIPSLRVPVSPVVVAGGVVCGTWELDDDRVRVAWFSEARQAAAERARGGGRAAILDPRSRPPRGDQSRVSRRAEGGRPSATAAASTAASIAVTQPVRGDQAAGRTGRGDAAAQRERAVAPPHQCGESWDRSPLAADRVAERGVTLARDPLWLKGDHAKGRV